MPTAADSAAPPLAHSIPGAAKTANSSRSHIYEQIKEGRLRAKKIGRRTVILDDELRRWLRSLPDLKPAEAQVEEGAEVDANRRRGRRATSAQAA